MNYLRLHVLEHLVQIKPILYSFEYEVQKKHNGLKKLALLSMYGINIYQTIVNIEENG